MLEKRKWVYISRPADFGMDPCDCGNKDIEWSEYKGHLWCEKCQKDYVPEHLGILDGPIPVGAARMMGISFDRFNLETKTVEIFNVDTCKWDAIK